MCQKCYFYCLMELNLIKIVNKYNMLYFNFSRFLAKFVKLYSLKGLTLMVKAKIQTKFINKNRIGILYAFYKTI